MTTQPQAPRRSEGSSPRCGQPGRLGRVVRMRLTVLGGCGAWPAAGQACSGYLVEDDGFRLLLDPGYAVVPRLLQRSTPPRLTRCWSATAIPTTAPTCTRCC